MLRFQDVLLLIAGVMVVPMILGIMSTKVKKGGAFTALASVIAVVPIIPVVHYLITTFLHHPELYSTTNWTGFLVLTLQFVTLSLAIIDAIVLGGAFTKEPGRTIISVVVCIAICSAFFFGLDYFNENMNHVHFILKDVMHSFDNLSKPI